MSGVFLNTCLYNTAASKRTRLPHTCQISGISWHASLHFPIECKQRIVVYTKIYKDIQSISPYGIHMESIWNPCGIHVEPIRPSDFCQIPRDDQQRMLLNTITTRQAQTLGLEQRGSQGAAWTKGCRLVELFVLAGTSEFAILYNRNPCKCF